MTLREIHTMLQQQYDAVFQLHRRLPLMSSDTAFSLGEVLGVLSKAKALVGRDIDQRMDECPGPNTETTAPDADRVSGTSTPAKSTATTPPPDKQSTGFGQ